jgi:hypothetical protein
MNMMTSGRVLKNGKQPSLLPIPEIVRQRRSVEKWRERIWRVRHKYVVLLHPQYRDLMRKIACSMEKTDLHQMVIHLRVGLFLTWFLTGSIGKMEELILEIIRGRVFLMNGRLFLPENTPEDLPKLELRKRLLLYDPKCYPAGPDAAPDPEVTLFSDFLTPLPEMKLWLRQWAAEKDEVRRGAAAELGQAVADKLWTESGPAHAPATPEVRQEPAHSERPLTG